MRSAECGIKIAQRETEKTEAIHGKKPFLKHWSKLRANQKLSPKPVRHTHEGSTYAEDGVRITGSKAFVDSVLSRLHYRHSRSGSERESRLSRVTYWIPPGFRRTGAGFRSPPI